MDKYVIKRSYNIYYATHQIKSTILTPNNKSLKTEHFFFLKSFIRNEGDYTSSIFAEGKKIA